MTGGGGGQTAAEEKGDDNDGDSSFLKSIKCSKKKNQKNEIKVKH